MIEMHQHTGVAPKILVSISAVREDIKKQFHCPVCGEVAFEFYGEIRGLVPGGHITQEDHEGVTMLVVQCKGKCKKFELDANGNLVPVMYREHVPAMVPCKTQFYIS